jgi:hypothetical protein
VWGKSPADSAGKVELSVAPLPVATYGNLGAAQAQVFLFFFIFVHCVP